MLVGIIGSLCAGKETVAHFLVKHRGFQRIAVGRPKDATPSPQHNFPTVNGASNVVVFPTPEEALDHCTSNWLKDYVIILPVDRPDFVMAEFRRRPFFLLVGVEAPTLMRFQRWIGKKKYEISDERKLELLEEFLRLDERGVDVKVEGALRNMTLQAPPTPPQEFAVLPTRSPHITSVADPDVRLLNHCLSVASLAIHLSETPFLHPTRLRPDWDTYFMRLCDLASTRSNCMKRRVGCILAKDMRVVATGYNGTPRGVRNCNEGGCGRCNGNVSRRGEGLGECLCLHAEENAILEAGRERIGGCAKKIVQAGVKRVVYAIAYSMDDITRRLFEEAGIEMLQHHDLPKVIVCR
ncbi:hypothetical protein HDU67_005504 [Dinochytrium kinnereticum]|nr:hypothetical protein HDU67_005504 [Dinochytrium kinnereticum]